jgi:integrase
MPVRMIDQRMIVDALADLNKRHPEQARRALRVWAQVLDYAKAMGMREGDNPAAWRGNMEHIFPDRPKNHNKHHASMPFKDVPEFVQRLRLRQVKGTSAAALEFQILCASRPGEVLSMKWSEVDLVNRIWTLPPERTKQNRQHRVPFSERCTEILALQNEYRKGQPFALLSDDFVFQGYKGEALDDKSLRELLKRMDLPVHVTPHGFRSSFRNWAQRTHFNNPRIDRDRRDLAELSLGHSIKGKVEEAYWTEDALDERRPIMDAWSTYCDGSAT